MFKITIELPASSDMATLPNGDPFKVDWTKVPANVLADIVVNGGKIVMNNVKNSNKGDEEAKMTARRNAWYEGNYTIVDRGDSWMTELKEQFVFEQAGKGKTPKQVDAEISATVKHVFGEKEKATFSKYLDAVATVMAKANGEEYEAVRGGIESDLADRMRDRRNAQAKTAAKIDVSELILSAFAK